MSNAFVEAARASTERAAKARDELGACLDFASFRDAWTDFLIAHNRALAMIGKWAETKPHSRPWWSNVRQTRKSDPALSYLHQSRNAHEHGVEKLHERSGPTFVIKFEGPMSFCAAGMTPLGEVTLSQTWLPPRPKLVPITNRGRVYRPPSSLLDVPLSEATPQALAGAALGYLHELLRQVTVMSNGSK